MGASTFRTMAKGPNMAAAFKAAVKSAQYDHGHSGYTGTIAEKREFVAIQPPKSVVDKVEYADKLIADDDPRVGDKWGPAGGIQVAEGEYLFFGWASQ